MADRPQEGAFYEAIGKNIRKWRDQRGLTQSALATVVGLTRTSLTNIENGRQHPPLYTFCEIAEQLKVTVSELLPESAATVIVDVKKIAGEQMLQKGELQFIESAISNQRTGLDGHQKKKNTDARRKPSS